MNPLGAEHAVRTERPPHGRAAVAAATGFLAIAVFQAALAMGAPSAVPPGAGPTISSRRAFASQVRSLSQCGSLPQWSSCDGSGSGSRRCAPRSPDGERGSWSACSLSVH